MHNLKTQSMKSKLFRELDSFTCKLNNKKSRAEIKRSLPLDYE